MLGYVLSSIITESLIGVDGVGFEWDFRVWGSSAHVRYLVVGRAVGW